MTARILIRPSTDTDRPAIHAWRDKVAMQRSLGLGSHTAANAS